MAWDSGIGSAKYRWTRRGAEAQSQINGLRGVSARGDEIAEKGRLWMEMRLNVDKKHESVVQMGRVGQPKT
jgi:phage terminase large subunit GpA-like protein